MNSKMQQMQQQMAKLPDYLLERFLILAQGADMAMDAMGLKEKEGTKDEGDKD